MEVPEQFDTLLTKGRNFNFFFIPNCSAQSALHGEQHKDVSFCPVITQLAVKKGRNLKFVHSVSNRRSETF